MTKDLNNLFDSRHGASELEIRKALDEGKTVIAAVQTGKFASESLKNGYSDYLDAHIELSDEKPTNNQKCFGCENIADSVMYFWK